MPSRQQRPHSAHSSTRKYYRTNNPKSPSSKLKVSLPTSSSGSSTFQEFVAVEEKLSTQRKQLPLRNVHVSLNTEYRRRPMSAHSRTSINNHPNHNNKPSHNNKWRKKLRWLKNTNLGPMIRRYTGMQDISILWLVCLLYKNY